MKARNTAAVLYERIDRSDDGCWEWTAARGTRYGIFSAAGEKWAHRAAYALLIGPIPKGLEIDHLCRNTFCVNPDHLEAVTHAENVRRHSAHIRATTPHGTHARYHHGCRCQECKGARAEYGRSLRARNRKALADGLVFPPHGRVSTGTNYGCKCDLCNEARRRAARKAA